MEQVEFSQTAFRVAGELFLAPKTSSGEPIDFPRIYDQFLSRTHHLRYGDNPHQRAAMYDHADSNLSPLENLTQLWGRGWPDSKATHKGLSLTNARDIDAGIEATRWFKRPTAVIVKHQNPCGIACADTIEEAVTMAIASDPDSAFGGALTINRPANLGVAQEVSVFKKEGNSNIDVVAAPSYRPSALKLLREVRGNMNVYSFGRLSRQRPISFQIIAMANGFAAQTWNDDYINPAKKWEVMTEKYPTEEQIRQMLVGWAFVNAVKSNAVLVPRLHSEASAGIGSGQTSRVRSTAIALEQAGEQTKGGIAISDGFIPFIDSIQLMKDSGISAIVQPGGSQRDKKVIDTANQAGITMVFTHQRAFRH